MSAQISNIGVLSKLHSITKNHRNHVNSLNQVSGKLAKNLAIQFFYPLVIFIFLFFGGFVSASDDELPVFATENILEDFIPIGTYTAVTNHNITSVEHKMQGESIQIKLGNFHFDPLVESPIVANGLNKIQRYESDTIGYYIVQFDGPIDEYRKRDLEKLNVELFDYIPDFAFLVRMNSAMEASVLKQEHVRWLGIYQPSYRLSQAVLGLASTQELSTESTIRNQLRVTTFPEEDINRITEAIAGLDGAVEDISLGKWKTTIIINISVDNTGALASIPGVKWVELMPEWQLYNNTSTDIMNVRTVRDNFGLYGEGQTVGVCDSGLDQGWPYPTYLHDDFENGAGVSRVIQIIDLVGDGAGDINAGHGTHVAGSVLGNGVMSGCIPNSNYFPDICFAGIAPKANLVFHAFEKNSEPESCYPPSDLNTLFAQSKEAGADLHTNSWGGKDPSGQYNSFSEDVDEYVWDNPDFLILFAAGNAGVDSNGDGVVDLGSMGAPGTAKNCLTIGASEGNRPLIDLTWGMWWPLDYYTDPILSDLRSDNTSGLAAFSGRGPTMDGRYKPDLVAPGTDILSVRSLLASGTLWGIYGANPNYQWSGGTSMATPLAAGAAALMREYLGKEKGLLMPSAALLKAALINAADNIAPGQYGTGITQEIPDSVPNNMIGWGRLNLGNSVYPSAPFDILYYDQTIANGQGLTTNASQQFTFNVIDSQQPLSVNLVWSDYPGTPVAQGGLVNDLDIKLTDPSSTVYYANNASLSSSLSVLSYDSDNPELISNFDNFATRFTPAFYPAKLESATFYFYNPDNSTTPVDLVIYGDISGLPGTQLFRQTLTYIPTGWNIVTIPDVTINSGDFYIAIEKNDVNQYIYLDGNNPTGRSLFYNGSDWITCSYAVYIRAHVRSSNISMFFDRINNVLGLTLNSPAIGAYTVDVSGYNVPYGPQPYALVISGDINTGDVAYTCETGPVSIGPVNYNDGDIRLVQSESSIITSGDVIANSGSVISYEATNSITLNPGFEIRSGSRFSARITPVNCP